MANRGKVGLPSIGTTTDRGGGGRTNPAGSGPSTLSGCGTQSGFHWTSPTTDEDDNSRLGWHWGRSCKLEVNYDRVRHKSSTTGKRKRSNTALTWPSPRPSRGRFRLCIGQAALRYPPGVSMRRPTRLPRVENDSSHYCSQSRWPLWGGGTTGTAPQFTLNKHHQEIHGSILAVDNFNLNMQDGEFGDRGSAGRCADSQPADNMTRLERGSSCKQNKQLGRGHDVWPPRVEQHGWSSRATRSICHVTVRDLLAFGLGGPVPARSPSRTWSSSSQGSGRHPGMSASIWIAARRNLFGRPAPARAQQAMHEPAVPFSSTSRSPTSTRSCASDFRAELARLFTSASRRPPSTSPTAGCVEAMTISSSGDEVMSKAESPGRHARSCCEVENGFVRTSIGSPSINFIRRTSTVSGSRDTTTLEAPDTELRSPRPLPGSGGVSPRWRARRASVPDHFDMGKV